MTTNNNDILIIYSDNTDRKYLKAKALTTLADNDYPFKEVKNTPIFYMALGDIKQTWLSDKDKQNIMKLGFAVEWRESGRGSYIVFDGDDAKNYPDSVVELLAMKNTN